MVEQAEQKSEVEQAIAKARGVVLGAGRIDPGEGLELAARLLAADQIGWARRLLDRVVQNGIEDPELARQVAQKRALATYKDPHLNRDYALDRAMEMLQQAFDLATTSYHEPLGLAGAICKRKWEVDTDRLHLERSLRFYRRGYAAGIAGDAGYTAINAAFILDLLAYLEESHSELPGGQSLTAPARRREAQKIRREVIEYLSAGPQDTEIHESSAEQYWRIVTLAEACFGLQRFDEAKDWLRQARTIDGIADWKYVTSAKQLVQLTRIQTGLDLTGQELEQTAAWQALIDFLGQNADALRTLFQGKLGLALSGGGFRASLYHIGVLAKLAEHDLLRHVEVLSCVSGGSIVGAHYYLELRRLFQVERKLDQDVRRDDYVSLVSNLVKDFTAGVQENPRIRILANPWSNLKMIFFPSYSRTQRLGELYEKLIYSRVEDGEGERERWLTDLYIHPPEQPKDFSPRRDNWARRCKVLDLVLNATTLNNGHNWQFTASWMGESPVNVNPDVDSNQRYRRMYYSEAPATFRKVRLGDAVGASSCVPGLFEPIILKGLYPEITVRLVDGGVFDNQGVSSLLEQDCDVIIASDAVGQLNTVNDPGGGIIKPLMRTNSTLMHRVRGAQYQDLKARERSALLKGFAYMHLKQGLGGEAVDWIDCQEPARARAETDDTHTPYGIRKDIQQLISAIRTDLDSFSDLECYALMTSGYHATELAVTQLEGFPIHQGAAPDWEFLKVEPEMTQQAGSGGRLDRLRHHLEASPMMFLKVWSLYRPLTLIAVLLGVCLLAGLIYASYVFPGWRPFAGLLQQLGELLSLKFMMSTLLAILVGYALMSLFGSTAKVVMRITSFNDTLRRLLVGLGVGIFGWVGAFLHLHLFDRIFKRLGRVE